MDRTQHTAGTYIINTIAPAPFQHTLIVPAARWMAGDPDTDNEEGYGTQMFFGESRGIYQLTWIGETL